MIADLDGLFEALSSRSISEPIELEDQIIIPITKISIGFGTNIGRTGQDASKECLEKCTAGGGVRLSPVAVVIIFRETSGPKGVKVVPLSKAEGFAIRHREKTEDKMAHIKVE